MNLSQVVKKNRFWFFLILLSVLCSYLLLHLPITSVVIDSLNQRLYDTILILTSSNEKKTPINDIVIVDIDEKSIQTLGQFSSWPMLYFAKTLDYISSGNPMAVGYDIFFTEPDSLNQIALTLLTNHIRQNTHLDTLQVRNILSRQTSDASFAESMAKAGNVFLAMFNQSDYPTRQNKLPANLTAWNVKTKQALRIKYPMPPIPILAEKAYGVGFAHIEPNRSGVVHDFPLFFAYNGKQYVNFSFQMCLDLLGIDSMKLTAKGLQLYNHNKLERTLPLDSQGRFYLNFYGARQAFRTISFSDILQGRVPAKFFHNKIILFGSSATGLYDLKVTPLDNHYPGVELHATFIRNVLNSECIHWVSPYILTILALLVLILLVIYTRRTEPLKAVLVYFGLVLVSFIAALLIYRLKHYAVNFAEYCLPWSIAFFIAIIDQYRYHLKDKRILRNAFEHFVAKDVVRDVMDNPKLLRVGGKLCNVTVMMCDIRNFTDLCEKMAPDEIVHLLHDYFNQITPQVLVTHGMLDKYIGDAMVALYNVPIAREGYTENCCQAALEIIRIADAIRDKHSEHPVFQTFRNGIGITSGHLVVGNMGSDFVFDYTGIGDIMNLSSRLEGLNKYYNTRIILDEQTSEKVKDTFLLRKLDCVAVKGRQDCTHIYELLAHKRDVADNSSLLQLQALYESALTSYSGGHWDTAIAELTDLLRLFPDDGPSLLLLNRSRDFQSAPPEEFCGTWKFHDK